MSNNLFFENRAIYEIMRKNIVTLMAIWRMDIAFWITMATDTHSEYVTLIAFSTETMFAGTHPIVT